MPVTLTIKQVPDELAARLRALAARNHRSIQGELMHTLETLLAAQDSGTARAPPPMQPEPGAALQPTPMSPPTVDDLLVELDHIVAGTHWGDAPMLSREQANDRGLTREIDHLMQERQTAYRR